MIHFNMEGLVSKVFAYINLDADDLTDKALESAVFTRSVDLDDDQIMKLLDLLPLRPGYTGPCLSTASQGLTSNFR